MGATILEALNELTAKLDEQDTQDELVTLGEKIDALADRVAPDGSSVQATLHAGMLDVQGVAYLSSLVTEAQTGNISLSQIVSALEPLQELTQLAGIAQAITQCCGDDRYDEPVPSDMTYDDVCNDEKCRRTKLVLGGLSDLMENLIFSFEDIINAEWGEMLKKLSFYSTATKIIIPMVAATAESASLLGLVYAVTNMLVSGELEDVREKYHNIREDILCAYYTAETLGDGYDASMPIIDSSDMTPQGKEVMKMFLKLIFYLGAPFVKANFNIPEFFNRLEDAGMGKWHTNNCSNCTGCSGLSGPCDPVKAPGQANGEPSIFDESSNPVDGDYGSTAYGGTGQRIAFNLGAYYHVTITLLGLEYSDVGVSLAVKDCDGNTLESQIIGYADIGTPYTLTGEDFDLWNYRSGGVNPFTVRLSFDAA